MLTERRAQLLRLLIWEYVESALPVGSETLVHKHGLRLSPATIRNELAHLEEEGFITHPHTSAGRLPAEKGYRHYVEFLMEEEDLAEEEKATIRHQFYQAPGQLEQWVQLAAAVLAHASGNAAVVTEPRSSQARLKQLELVELHDRAALLILVLEQARVHQQLLVLPQPLGQAELSVLSAKLNGLCAGRSAREIRELRGEELTRLELLLLDLVGRVLEAEDATAYGETHLEGLTQVLRQPEFSSAEKMLALLQALEERSLAEVIPFTGLARQGVTVVIGSENPQSAMRECSVVAARYGVPGRAFGALGVVGPTRMRYPRAISTVRYMADVMSELLSGVYR